MFWVIILYFLPAVVNLILLRDICESLLLDDVEDKNEIWGAYAIMTFLPVVNFMVFLYIILIYVFKIPRKD